MKKILYQIKTSIINRKFDCIIKGTVFFLVLSILFTSIYIINVSKNLESNITSKYNLLLEVNRSDQEYYVSKADGLKYNKNYEDFITNLNENTKYGIYERNYSSGFKIPIKMIDIEDDYALYDRISQNEYDKDFIIYGLTHNGFTLDASLPRSTINEVPKEFMIGHAELIEGRFFFKDELKNNDKVCLIPEGLAKINENKLEEINVDDYITISEIVVDDDGQLIHNIAHKFKVIGIYSSVINSGFDTYFGRTEHPVYISEGNFFSLFDNATKIYDENNIKGLEDKLFYMKTNVLYKFNTINDMRYFINYFKKLPNENNYSFKTSIDEIYPSVQNVLFTSNTITYIAYVSFFISIIIIILFILFDVDSRKNEFGILEAMGESYLELTIYYILELAIILITSMLLASIVAYFVGKLVFFNTIGVYDLNNLNQAQLIMDLKAHGVEFKVLGFVSFLFEAIPYVLCLLVISSIVFYLFVRKINAKDLLKSE